MNGTLKLKNISWIYVPKTDEWYEHENHTAKIIHIKNPRYIHNCSNRITPTTSNCTRRWLFQSAHRVLEETKGYSFDVLVSIISQ
jgi:hypothetical protein